MAHQLYRNTTVGHCLQESLDELMQYDQLSPALAMKVLLQFDKAISTALANRVKSRLTFKARKLNTYRFCDNVWTLMLSDAEFKEVQDIAKADRLKIVAMDGRAGAGLAELNMVRHRLPGLAVRSPRLKFPFCATGYITVALRQLKGLFDCAGGP